MWHWGEPYQITEQLLYARLLTLIKLSEAPNPPVVNHTLNWRWEDDTHSSTAGSRTASLARQTTRALCRWARGEESVCHYDWDWDLYIYCCFHMLLLLWHAALHTIGPGAPFSPGAPASPWREEKALLAFSRFVFWFTFSSVNKVFL